MKIALITTTIDVPNVLALYRKLDPDVRFFVVGDLKTPHETVAAFCEALGNARYIHPDDQQRWKCSYFIGWNCIQRRNIALLEAIEWGADIIYSCDTDDLPLSSGHFAIIQHLMSDSFSGIELRASSGWVDPGWLVDPPVAQRGMPFRLDRFFAHPTVNKKIGVVASTVLGSCDVAAVDRVVGMSKRHCATALADAGVIVDPAQCRTLFNSEAVAFTRAIAPACMVLSGVGRYDDLYASLIAQKVMAEQRLCVHLGWPQVWHERSDRDPVVDLRAEIDGMEHIREFARCVFTTPYHECLDAFHLKAVWNVLASAAFEWLPNRTVEAAQAFLEDVRGVI